MSTSSISLSSTGHISVSGLASGLNTSELISELMDVEREPVTHVSDEKAKLQAQQTALQNVQTSLQALANLASEFSLPSLFESSQSVTSSEPTRVAAATTSGAGVGGYEVEVTQLANSAQRTYTFTSPSSEETITVGGQEFTLKAGETAKQLASAINSNSSATVYAAALENGTVVLSSRTTGASSGEAITLSGGAALVEVAGTAKEGKDAEYTVDGVAGTSTSNTVTEAIAGVTLTFNGLTTTGPVTIDVQAPGPSAATVETQVQSFIKLYNSTVESLQKQLNTKPPVNPTSTGEYSTGVLFANQELMGLLNGMRESMYESIAGLEEGMTSPADIGISTGAATGNGATSQASLEGQLTLDTGKLSEALKGNPEGVQKMLQQWSQALQSQINGVGGPAGTLEAQVSGDTTEMTQLTSQITSMNEMLTVREKALQETYAQLESVISKNTEQSDWLTEQVESLETSGI